MLRLYYHPLSPYCRKALVAVYHRSDPVSFDVVDIFGDGTDAPTFRRLSPFGKMPVLETPEGVIYESTSIIEYLECGGPSMLIPRGATMARLARHYDRLGDLYIINAQKELWWCACAVEESEARALVTSAWRLLSEPLADGRPFLLGQWFTLADIGPAIGSDYLVRIGMRPPKSVLLWLQRCFSIPAMHRALNEALPFANTLLEQRQQRDEKAFS